MKRTLIAWTLLVAAGVVAAETDLTTRDRATLLALDDARSFRREVLAELVARPDPTVRRAAAQVLGRLDTVAALPLLEKLAADASSSVRAAAVEAVGHLGQRWPGALPAEAGARAGEIVARGLKDPAPAVRGAACWAAPVVLAGRAELLRRAAAHEVDRGVRARALAELWRDPEKAWVPVAVKAAGHPDARLRLAAVWSLARGGDASADGALARAANDANAWVRVVALSAARRGHAAVLWATALQAATSGHAMVRTAALDALAAALEKEPTRTLPAELVKWLQVSISDRDPERAHERVAAIRLAGVARECGEALVAVREGDESWLAAEAAAALGWFPERAAETIGLAGAAGDPRRLAVIRALPRVAGSTETIRTLLEDGDAAVRLAAVDAAGDVGGETLQSALTGRLGDEDAVVRAAALEALRAGKASPSVSALLDLLRRERESQVPDAAIAVIDTLREPGELTPEVRGALRGALTSRHPSVARSAWAALVAHGEEVDVPGVATGHDEEHYRKVARWSAKPRFIEIVTQRGTIQVALNAAGAPLAAYRLCQLADEKFFENLTIHRVVPTFVVQGSDPRGDGWGGPGFTLRHEDGLVPYEAGVVGLAHGGPDTSGSQLFVTLTRQWHLDGRYPVVGKVTSGLDVARRLRVGDRILRVKTGDELGTSYPIWYGRIAPARLDAEIRGWRAERLKYQPKRKWLDLLATAKLKYELVVAMGTWCGDSREQIPRLQAILRRLGQRSPFGAPRLVGTDRSKWVDRELFPFGPVEKVPTIVVTAGGSEIGRIVETPSSGRIEEDLVRILAPVEGWEVLEPEHE